LDAGGCEAADLDGADLGCVRRGDCEEGAEGEAVDELKLSTRYSSLGQEPKLTFPTRSVTACAAKICMKTAPILTMQPIPNVILLPSLSARYPDPMAPKNPPIEDEVLKAICQP
jgi:hypothetical protein